MAIPDQNEFEFTLRQEGGIACLTLAARDGMNRLTRGKIKALASCIESLGTAEQVLPLIISGVPNFSAGADLNEIAALTGAEACNFARDGQKLMNLIENYPAPVCAAVHGFCMGGGLDLALACRRRVAAKNAVFGHRGAALGLITGWGGTQRLPRLIGKARALQMFIEAEKVHAAEALRIGLIEQIAPDPLSAAILYIRSRNPVSASPPIAPACSAGIP